MEELLGIVVTKGIRNALSIVEKMNDPHVDDDFHRILIQYLKTGQAFDLKEGTPLYKSLNMTLFEITLPPPKDEADKSKGFKEFIGAMEQFYAGMQSISEGKNNEKENYFTLEVALSNTSDEVIVFAAIPNKHISLLKNKYFLFIMMQKFVKFQMIIIFLMRKVDLLVLMLIFLSVQCFP